MYQLCESPTRNTKAFYFNSCEFFISCTKFCILNLGIHWEQKLGSQGNTITSLCLELSCVVLYEHSNVDVIERSSFHIQQTLLVVMGLLIVKKKTFGNNAVN